MKNKMTKKEYRKVISELTARIKDTIFMENPSKDILEILEEDDCYTLKVTFVGSDIMQILGRIRREKYGSKS